MCQQAQHCLQFSFVQVTDLCTLRIPDYFLVTVMSTDGVITTTVQHPVTTVHITTICVTLPQNDDNCNLTVRINAGNSAGVSSPTNITVGRLMTTFSLWSDATATNYSSFIFATTILVKWIIGQTFQVRLMMMVGTLPQGRWSGCLCLKACEGIGFESSQAFPFWLISGRQ